MKSHEKIILCCLFLAILLAGIRVKHDVEIQLRRQVYGGNAK